MSRFFRFFSLFPRNVKKSVQQHFDNSTILELNSQHEMRLKRKSDGYVQS